MRYNYVPIKYVHKRSTKDDKFSFMANFQEATIKCKKGVSPKRYLFSIKNTRKKQTVFGEGLNRLKHLHFLPKESKYTLNILCT